MAETGDQGNHGDQGAAAPQPSQAGQAPQMPQVRLLAHFVRDLSFENVGVIQGTPIQGQPEIAVQVHLDGGNIGEGNYQLNMKINAKATKGETTRFLVELDYGGIFEMRDAPETHVHPLLFIECPRLLWPFARRVVADVTRDGGHPSLMLETIDFAALYRQKIEAMRRQQQAAAGGQEGAQTDETASPQAAAPGNGAAGGQKPN